MNGWRMNAERMLARDSPHELFSLRVDVCYRDATDPLPLLGEVDDAEIPKLGHDQMRQVAERRFVIERAAENPTRLGEK